MIGTAHGSGSIAVAGQVRSPLGIFGGALHTWLSPGNWTLASGEIDVWSDASGNGNHFSAPSAGVRPAVHANWRNGRSAASFVAAADYLRCSAYHASLAQPAMKVVVLDITSTIAQVIVSGADGTNRMHIAVSSGPVWRARANTAQSGGVPAVSTPYSVRYLLEADASGTDKLNVNGTDVISADSGDLSEFGGYLGADSSGSFGLLGRVAEVIFVAGATTADQRSELNAYLAGTWGAF